MSCGVIYVATGPIYLELAHASALTLRATNPDLPIDLYTDQPAANSINIFDEVHAVPIKHSRAKLECLPLSRFERTLFLDCDTLVVGNLGDVFDILDKFEMALAHDVRRASGLVQEGLKESTPYAFPQMNSGVFLYRRSKKTRSFFEEWSNRFHESNVSRDQIILKDLLWTSDVSFYVLPPEFNLRRVTVLDAWEPLDAEVKIIHSHRLMQHIRFADQAKVTNLEELVLLERDALALEWKDAGFVGGSIADKIEVFTACKEDKYRG